MFCRKCGAKVLDGASYCISCGNKIDFYVNNNSVYDKNNHTNNEVIIIEKPELKSKCENKTILQIIFCIMFLSVTIIMVISYFTKNIDETHNIKYSYNNIILEKNIKI